MTMVRGAFSNLLAPGFRKIVFESYKEKPTEGSKLVNMNSSKRAYEEDFPIAGFGVLLQKAEGQSLAYQDALQGVAKRYLWTTYALGFRITQEMMDDDLYGIMGGKMSRALGRSARNNFEVISHAPYNSAFTTTVSGFVAGESLCDTAHDDLRGGSQGNRPATDADIALAPLQAGIENFHNMTDHSGLPMMMVPKMLAHSVADHWEVSQLLKSSHLPDVDTNAINQLANEGLQPHLSHYLTDVGAWFLIGDEHDINYFDRRKVAFSNTDDFDTGDAKFKLTRRNGSGWGDWRGIYGTDGV